MQWLIVDIIDA